MKLIVARKLANPVLWLSFIVIIFICECDVSAEPASDSGNENIIRTLKLVGHQRDNMKILIEWNEIPGAIAYKIYRRTEKQKDKQFISSVQENRYADAEFTCFTPTYYSISYLDVHFNESKISKEQKIVPRDDRSSREGEVISEDEYHEVSLRLPRDSMCMLDDKYADDIADIRVITKPISIERHRGYASCDWKTTISKETYQVTKVEKGEWSEEHLTFYTVDRRPMAGSGWQQKRCETLRCRDRYIMNIAIMDGTSYLSSYNCR